MGSPPYTVKKCSHNDDHNDNRYDKVPKPSRTKNNNVVCYQKYVSACFTPCLQEKRSKKANGEKAIVSSARITFYLAVPCSSLIAVKIRATREVLENGVMIYQPSEQSAVTRAVCKLTSTAQFSAAVRLRSL